MTETDKDFVERLKADVFFTVQQIMPLSDAVHLFSLALRGAETHSLQEDNRRLRKASVPLYHRRKARNDG